jgi:hypothetical protein
VWRAAENPAQLAIKTQDVGSSIHALPALLVVGLQQQTRALGLTQQLKELDGTSSNLAQVLVVPDGGLLQSETVDAVPRCKLHRDLFRPTQNVLVQDIAEQEVLQRHDVVATAFQKAECVLEVRGTSQSIQCHDDANILAVLEELVLGVSSVGGSVAGSTLGSVALL